jgi:transcriptional regulator with XRE-family HTH domain
MPKSGPKRAVTLADVAKAAGVSLSTASKALNGRDEVSGITRSYLPGPLLYLTATLLAFVSSDASLVMYAAIAIFYVASATLWGRRASEPAV